MTERVAVFPLGTVLFPGQLLPLHIFEPRYRALVDDLLAGGQQDEQRGFAVVAIRVGRETGVDGVHALHSVGTFAVLRAVHAHDDGRFDIVTQGARRFRLRALHLREQPYAVGEVDWLRERPGRHAEACAGLVRQLHREYRESIGAPLDPDDVADPATLSYRVATTTVLTSEDQQALLEAPDDAQRLRAEARLLRREIGLWRGLRSLPDVTAARSPIALN